MKQKLIPTFLIVQILCAPSFAGGFDAMPVLVGLAAALMGSGKGIDLRTQDIESLAHQTPNDRKRGRTDGSGSGSGSGGGGASSGGGSGSGSGYSGGAGGGAGDDGDDDDGRRRGNRRNSNPPGYPRASGGWTAKEDAALRKAVAEFSEKNWKAIAERFAQITGRSRSDVQCLQRWTKVLKPGIQKGAWTPEEDVRLRGCVESLVLVGKDISWSAVADSVGGGRIGKQCRERWTNHLASDINKDPWTPEEDALLDAGFARLGSSWAEIARSIPGRSENHVKNRWASLQRRRATAKRASASAVSSSSSAASASASASASSSATGRAMAGRVRFVFRGQDPSEWAAAAAEGAGGAGSRGSGASRVAVTPWTAADDAAMDEALATVEHREYCQLLLEETGLDEGGAGSGAGAGAGRGRVGGDGDGDGGEEEDNDDDPEFAHFCEELLADDVLEEDNNDNRAKRGRQE